MAIQLVSTTKTEGGLYMVTVQDTGQQIGTEDGVPVYKTYTVPHNPNQAAAELKARIEKTIGDDLSRASDIVAVELAIKTTVESIDTAKLTTKEVS